MLDDRGGEPALEAAELGQGGQLLVATWRRLAVGDDACPLIAREFTRACGEDGAEVLATLSCFLRALAYAGRRRLRVGRPGLAGLTGDERQLLALIAAAQADDDGLVELHLHWLARAELRLAVAITARALARALKLHDLLLPPLRP